MSAARPAGTPRVQVRCLFVNISQAPWIRANPAQLEAVLWVIESRRRRGEATEVAI